MLFTWRWIIYKLFRAVNAIENLDFLTIEQSKENTWRILIGEKKVPFKVLPGVAFLYAYLQANLMLSEAYLQKLKRFSPCDGWTISN